MKMESSEGDIGCLGTSALRDLLDRETGYDPTIEAIIARIRKRSEDGMEKYGQSLRDNNSKSFKEWIEDVQEEMYDAIAYLEKIKELLMGVKGG
jgi:mevalonate pyrophosphate decarboxylase